MKLASKHPRCAIGARLVAIFLSLPPLYSPATSRAAQYLDFTYEVSGANIAITHYSGPGGSVTIPETIDGIPVTSIGSMAFSQCVSLRNVIIPGSVASIGESAFYNCSGLTSVTIPDGVITIGSFAFCGNTSVTNIAIGTGLASLGDGAFTGGDRLAAITVNPLNPAFTSANNVLLTRDEKTLVQCPANLPRDYSVPASVETIGRWAFYSLTSLTNVTIPDRVATIGGGAFEGCANLAGVTLGQNVKTIEFEAFFGCARLAGVTIPDSVASLGNFAFANCSGMTWATIGGGVTNIGDQAFTRCASLRGVAIPDSVTHLGSVAFSGCGSLAMLTLGNGLTAIENWTFADCADLPSVVIGGRVTSIGPTAFLRCQSLTNVSLPDSLIEIGNAAFAYCGSLAYIDIPASVRNIGETAFADCEHLAIVSFNGDAPVLGPNVFQDSNTVTVYYRPGTKGWGSTFAGRRAVPDYLKVLSPLDSAMALENTAATLSAGIGGVPFPSYQWYYDGQSLVGATNPLYQIPSVSAAHAGDYMVIGRNAMGAVTNGPATLGVHNVVAAHYPGLVLTGAQDTPRQIQSAGNIAGPWTLLSEWAGSNGPAVFIDFTATQAGQRFYRTTPPTHLEAWLFPGWTLTGAVDSGQRIEYVNAETGFTHWQFLTNVTLPESPYLFIDISATNRWPRFYRTTPLP